MRIRLISSLGAAALTAALGFAAPALASPSGFQASGGKLLPGAPAATSESAAGYDTTVSSPNAMSVTTTVVVPTVKNCGTTRKVIIPFVSANDSGDTAAVGLDIHCRNGKVINFPIFAPPGGGPNKAFAHARAHPGDTVVLRLSWNATSLSLAVVDKTHPSVTRTVTGAGSSSFSDPGIGDSVIEPNVPVPDFGKVNFSKSQINGRALGLARGLTRVNLVNASDVLQIKTGPLASNNESFTTTFKHS